jgi:hypothetical protein
MLKHVQGLLETQYRNSAIMLIASVCPESELKKWLDMAPYSVFSRRYCLTARASVSGNMNNVFVQQGIESLEVFAKQLDRRYPDILGAPGKVQYHNEILQTIRSFGNGEVPDGWKLYYAYKQLVLSACLFACGNEAEGWENFNSAIEKCKYVFSLNEEWLEVGGELFAGIKVSKDWNYAIDREGNKHKLFNLVNLSRYHMSYINDLLSNPRWAWFDSVRNTDSFRDAVAWSEMILKAQREEQ